MALFFTILLTMFIAEMGDKTQLLLVAMTSRFKLRDIIIGSAASILVLNGLAVGVGSIISKFVPLYLIKIIAALAFFGDYFSLEDSGALVQRLLGVALEEGALRAALDGCAIGRYFSRLDLDTFLSILLQ